jgi:uncharacterized protein (DUF1810 family)
MSTGGFDPRRFLDAQAPVLDQVLRELDAGDKRSHWMWFVFPQLAGLGHSPTARHYALSGQAAAQAYAAHPVLGARLRDCTVRVLRHAGRDVRTIFGSPDDLKFRSSMTLFSRAAPDEPAFRDALAAFFGAMPDQRTLQLLAEA